jgi:serine/threonine-protein kinase PknG
MVYCDFKPDNVMIEGDPPDVKLIDMGAVRLIDDPAGDIYGTKGYSAPEAGDGPTVASDLFTVGRTLAVLLMDFRFQGAHESTLPAPGEQPVLARHESLYRFLLKLHFPQLYSVLDLARMNVRRFDFTSSWAS